MSETYVCLAQGWQCPFLIVSGQPALPRYACGVGGGEICEEDLGETAEGAGCPLTMTVGRGPVPRLKFEKQRERYRTERTRWEMSRKGKDQVAWDEIMPGTDQTLYDEAVCLRGEGCTWNEVAKSMTETHGIEFKGPSVASMTKYHSDPERQAKRKKKAEALGGGAKPNDVVAQATSPVEESANAQPGSAVPRTARGGAPCMVHIARDGLEIWISAADDDELRVKAAQMINVLDLVVNL